MNKEYLRENTSVSLIYYHFIFCPKYRKKIFLDVNIEKRFKELVNNKCQQLKAEIIAMECQIDHAHMLLKCLPKDSPAYIMQEIKGYSSKILREEFCQLRKFAHLWSRSYFCTSVGYADYETIKKYIENQKAR